MKTLPPTKWLRIYRASSSPKPVVILTGRGVRQAIASFFYLLSISFATLCAGEREVYVDTLISKADQLELHRDPYWQLLLHYKPSWRGQISAVDDPAFFFHPRGKRDPSAELAASLRAFFALPVAGQPHAIERFVARWYWLKEELDIDPTRLPVPECEAYRAAVEGLKPQSATLIFPAAYMNSPASMFGHTLLVIDSEESNRLLSKGINYGADTRGIRFGPVFTVFALSGMLKGSYSVQPYYNLVEKYNDVSHRDLWEYNLVFTKEETERMLRHAWEMQYFWSRYYFFTENCSMNLLFLLDSARPDLNLRKQFRFKVIPADTVRAVGDAGLIAAVDFRASKASKIEHWAAAFTPDQQAVIAAHARGDGPDVDRRPGAKGEIPNHLRILAKDLKAEYCQYLYTAGALDTKTYRKLYYPLLRERSKMGQPDHGQEALFEVPRPERPDLGHPSGRVAVTTGLRDGDVYSGLQFRPAYHSLTDRSGGYPEGSQIHLLSGDVRYDYADADLEIERFDFVDIRSITPRDSFFQPQSWKVQMGMARTRFSDTTESMLGQVQTGAGRARRLGSALAYMFVDGDLRAGDLPGPDYAVGLGGSVGVLLYNTLGGNTRLDARSVYHFAGSEAAVYEVEFDHNISLGRNRSLQFTGGLEQYDSHSSWEGGLAWQVYF